MSSGPAASLNGRIRAELEQHILSGRWPPGHRIPSEHDLAAQFGCARMTVNKVLSGLAESGLIARRRKAGSFVAQPKVQSAVLQIPDIPAEVAARGERYGYQLLARGRRPQATGDFAFVGAALTLACRHLADGEPFALEERTISLQAVPEAEAADFTAEPPGSWLLRHVPWTEAEHHISAVNADRAQAAALGVARGAACLALERRTWRAAVPVTFVRQTFRGDRYRLLARFSPSEAQR